ncbi:MAG: MerR family mercuric resistance operon transcriptional regulator [Pseudoalteromonas distincta]|jgi:MerR family mercuric resistance operon transcriptional regulator
MAEPAIQIGELSRRTGCNIETIRYYERIGLMPAPPRRGRYRSYGGEDVGRLGFVRRARELGFTLDEVRALLGLAGGGGQASCAEVRTLAASHLTDVRARIADLRRMERVLADSVRACDAGQDPGCPLIQSLYAEPGRSTGSLDTRIPM